MITCNKLDVNTITKERCVSIGKIPAEIIDFLKEKMPTLVLSSNEDVLFWSDRIEHTLRHKDDFASDILYETCFEDIPSFISSPDYISVKNNSISFIKTYSQNVSVVIRITLDKNPAYRTMFPLMSAQLDKYIKDGKAWPYKNVDKDG